MESLYKMNCQFAVSHLFKVTASLDSMVIGEYQIQGQVRDAYFLATQNNATNNMLNKLFQTAIQIGKKIRSERLRWCIAALLQTLPTVPAPSSHREWGCRWLTT